MISAEAHWSPLVSSLNVLELQSPPALCVIHAGHIWSLIWNDNVPEIKKNHNASLSLSPLLNPEVVPIVRKRRPPCHGQARRHLPGARGTGGRADAGVHRGGSPQESLRLDGRPQQILREDVHWKLWGSGGQSGGWCCWVKVCSCVCLCVCVSVIKHTDPGQTDLRTSPDRLL